MYPYAKVNANIVLSVDLQNNTTCLIYTFSETVLLLSLTLSSTYKGLFKYTYIILNISGSIEDLANASLIHSMIFLSNFYFTDFAQHSLLLVASEKKITRIRVIITIGVKERPLLITHQEGQCEGSFPAC